jgi:carboxypeptidase PM20D1
VKRGDSRGRRFAIMRGGLALLIVLALLTSVLVINTLLIPSPPDGDGQAFETPTLDDAAPRRLATAITFRTISSREPGIHDPAPFVAFHAFLRDAFPRVHGQLNRTSVGGFSYLYEWRGRDPELKPVLFLAHQDVVPATDSAAWTHPPFAGNIEGGFIWGRGALDDKGALMGCLEAVEALLASGFRPARTVYLAFGQDEETGGAAGARVIAQHLAARDIRLEFVLDEGGYVGHNLIPGIDAPIAFVGTAEKGYLTIGLAAEEHGGHSSRPPAQTAIGVVSRAVVKLEDNPFPSRLHGGTGEMLRQLAPHMPFGQRLVIANKWLLEPLILRMLESDATMAALVRTTTAATMFEAGEQDNVLARHAKAVVNLRILPGESVDGTLERIRHIVDDPRVQVRTSLATEPSPASSTDSPAYHLLARSIREAIGKDVIVVPNLLFAGTDSRHFESIADDVYRFAGMSLTKDDIARFHGVDERISIDDYAKVVAVYDRLLRNLDDMAAQ